MSSIKKLLILTSAILFLAAACNKQAAVQPAQNQEPPKATDQASNFNAYTNTKFGYEIKYPKNFIIYISADEASQSSIPPTPTSDRVSISEKIIYGGETEALTVNGLSDKSSPKDWLRKNSSEYTSKEELKYIKQISFNGLDAWELKGSGNIASVNKVIALTSNNHLIVLELYTVEGNNDDQILSTFKFTK